MVNGGVGGGVTGNASHLTMIWLLIVQLVRSRVPTGSLNKVHSTQDVIVCGTYYINLTLVLLII